MGKSAIYSDAAIKNLEFRLKHGSVKGSEALGYLTKLLPVLRRRTKKMEMFSLFAEEVSAEDRLYIEAWRVWKRKAVLVGGTCMWVRANAPVLQPEAAPEQPQDPQAVVKSILPPRW
jgi:hypothetical protein